MSFLKNDRRNINFFLSSEKLGSFVIRPSMSKGKGVIALSIRSDILRNINIKNVYCVVHAIIVEKNNKIYINPKHKFTSIYDLIHYHKKHGIYFFRDKKHTKTIGPFFLKNEMQYYDPISQRKTNLTTKPIVEENPYLDV